ncbi:MAG: GntR family transcriptional regulator [Anaerolineae bacterium]
MPTTTHARLRNDSRPLYSQASEALKALIAQGEYQPGDRLPSEHELSDRLGISRPTLREALRQLEEERAIIRRHGVGTFVASPPPVIETGLEVLESLERLARRLGLHTQMSEVHMEERPATPVEREKLGLAEGGNVTVITRVIEAAGQRIAYLTDVVPVAYLCCDELAADFQGSVLDHFLARGQPVLSHSRTELIAEAANSELARRLHIQRGAPLLRLEAQLYAGDGAVVDYSTSYFVPGYFRFHVVRRIG